MIQNLITNQIARFKLLGCQYLNSINISNHSHLHTVLNSHYIKPKPSLPTKMSAPTGNQNKSATLLEMNAGTTKIDSKGASCAGTSTDVAKPDQTTETKNTTEQSKKPDTAESPEPTGLAIIPFEHFLQCEIALGTITKAQLNKKARKPAHKV